MLDELWAQPSRLTALAARSQNHAATLYKLEKGREKLAKQREKELDKHSKVVMSQSIVMEEEEAVQVK